jgi:hypothetical protein
MAFNRNGASIGASMAVQWTTETPQHKVSSPRVGVNELLNAKPFTCNLLNKLCSSNIFNDYHHLRLYVTGSVFM